MRHLILFSLFSVLAVAAFSQPSNRIKLRQLEAAPGSDYYIRSVNDTCAWVMNSEFADSLSVLQDSIIVLYANGSEVSRDTVGPFGSTGTVYYQLLRNDGSDQTERNATNFISTSTVVATLLDDSGSDETEVRMSVPTGGITTTEILDGTITTSDLAFTPVTDHGALTGLSDDDHTQYLLLSGRSTGQTAIGGSASLTLVGGTGTTADLNLKTTTGVGATGADIHFLVGNNGGTETATMLNNGNIGFGTISPQHKFEISGSFDYPAYPLSIVNTTSGSFATAFKILQPNAGAGDDLFWSMGKQIATNDMVTHEYIHSADGSTSNRYSMKFHSTNYFLTALASNKIGIGNVTTPVNTLDVEGAAAIGASYSGTSTAPSNGLIVQGNMGLGTATVVNKLDVEGAAAIGAAYSGTSTAPSNGLLVEGQVKIGTTATSGYKMDIVSSTGATSVARLSNSSTTGYSAFEVISDNSNRMGFGIANSAASSNANQAFFTVISAIPFIIETDDQTRMYIDDNETKIGFGNTAPDATIHITGQGSTNSTVGFLYENSSHDPVIYGDDGGSVGIMENLPARTLDVGGEVRIQDLTTDAPTGIVGHDGDGDLGTIAPGYGLSLPSSVLEVDTADLATQYDLLGVLDTVTYGRILFVSKNGNDGTGEIGNPHKCYLTIGGAYAAASAGDLLYFFPGSYTSTSNLGTKSLSWYLMPGVNLSGAGMQFDLSAGIKVKVFGRGVLSFTSGSVAVQANSAGEFISIEADSIYTNHFYFARTANGGQVYFNVRAVDMGSNCLNLFRLDGGKSTVNGSMSVVYSGVNNILVANQDTGTYKICKLDINVLVWTSTFYVVSISSDLNNSYIGLQINKLIDDSATTGGVFRFSNSGSTSSSKTVFSVNVKNYSGPQHFIDAVNGSIAADSTSTAYINCDNCRYTGTSAAILTRSSFGSTSYLRYVISGNWVSESAPLIKDSVSTNTFPIPLSIKDARLKVENGSYYAVHVYGFASTGSMFFRNVFFEGQSSGVPAISCATASTFRTAGAYQSNSDVDADATFVKYYELE